MRPRDIVHGKAREEARRLTRPHDPRVDADPPEHHDVRTEQVRVRRGDELEEAGPDELAVARADDLGPIAEVGERREGDAGLALQGVVHPHEPGRAACRATGDRAALQDDDPRPPSREVERGARAPRAGAASRQTLRAFERGIVRALPALGRNVLS